MSNRQRGAGFAPLDPDYRPPAEPTPPAEQHTLTYPGKVDPRPGSAMGPSQHHKVWIVVGATYDPTTNKTAVTVEEWQA